MNIGVLGLQGDVEEHISALKIAMDKLNIKGKIIWVKRPKDLEGLSGLIIPGGESTTIGSLMKHNGLLEYIKNKIETENLALWGTCAGLIIMAKKTYDKTVGETTQPLLRIIDMVVERNTYGRQKDSFEADLNIPIIGSKPFRGVFIRAPSIKEVDPTVEILATLDNKPVAIKQGIHMGTTFHPELTNDTRLHEYFLINIKH
ncbi:MAG: pyridoxal 5'-phosphate synthase glutaminase subunit PdxT [Thermoprotei archaeon]